MAGSLIGDSVAIIIEGKATVFNKGEIVLVWMTSNCLLNILDINL